MKRIATKFLLGSSLLSLSFLNLGQSALAAEPSAMISSGSNHTCAVTKASTLICWGDNTDGQIDIPSNLGPVANVEANGNNTCVVTTEHEVVCWGKEGRAPTLVPAKSVSGNGSVGCIVTLDNLAECWGSYTMRWSTYSGSFMEVRPYVVPAGLGQVTQTTNSVSNFNYYGGTFECALKVTAEVRCWGDSTDHLLTQVSLENVMQISQSDLHSCAVRSNGILACWGGPYSTRVFYWQGLVAGQTIGLPSISGKVVHVDAGKNQDCAVNSLGTVFCWDATFGDNSVRTAGIFLSPSGLGFATQVSTQDNGACALNTEDYVQCWEKDSHEIISRHFVGSLKKPTIRGAAEYGAMQQGSFDRWSEDALYRFSWYRNGTEIPGAIKSDYILGLEDIGKTLTFSICSHRPLYEDLCVTSQPTKPISSAIIRPNPRITISSTSVSIGSNLSAKVSGLPRKGIIKLQWRRDGKSIAGNTRDRYKISSSDKGHLISVRVEVSAPGYKTFSQVSAPKRIP